MPIKYTHLGHPAILCKHYDETLAFYVDKMGFEKKFSLYQDDGSLWLTYVEIAPGQFVELFPQDYPSANRTRERSFHHFCVEVDDYAAALEGLKERGVDIYWGPTEYTFGEKAESGFADREPGMCGSLCAFVRDPEGNDIEIMQFTDKSKQLM